jgi:hypothetical protein
MEVKQRLPVHEKTVQEQSGSGVMGLTQVKEDSTSAIYSCAITNWKVNEQWLLKALNGVLLLLESGSVSIRLPQSSV